MLHFIPSALVPLFALLCANADKRTDYLDVKTAKEAVEVCKKALVNDGKGEYAALLSEESVRDSIRTAVKGYESLIESAPQPGNGKHFREVVKPMLMTIAENGTWPKGCSFTTFYDLKDVDSNVYRGLGLRLEVATPDQQIKGFALPILDVWYGRFRQ